MAVTQNFMKGAPLSGVNGNPLEPALSLADFTRQFVLAPPFAWRWNRTTTTITTVSGTQDYQVTLTDFGWLEKASVNDNAGNPTSVIEIENKLSLSEDGSTSIPRYISARLDDDAGKITFRLLPKPDAVYTVSVTYQKASPIFANLTDTWSPIPDYLRSVYEYGFRAFAYEYFDDPRFAFTFQMFLRQLLAASEGLDETSKNAFLAQFVDLSKQQQGLMTGQIGRQGRGGY